MERRKLPLKALRAFEALGQSGQMSAAAKLLGVTHSAISQQIKALEEQLGSALFYRDSKPLRLTAAGSRLLEAVQQGFDLIVQGTEQLRSEELRGELNVACTPAMAGNWLARHLSDFHRQHPELHIRLLAIEAGAKRLPEGVDLAICYGRPTVKGMQVEELLRETFFPVCSPRLLQGQLRRHRPEDVLNYTLLNDNENNWDHWLQHFSLQDRAVRHQLSFFASNLAIDAARAGTGIALADHLEVAEDLRNGSLVRFCQESIPAPQSYFVLSSESAAAQVLRGWLLRALLA